MAKFELGRLDRYDDAALLDELRRVALLVTSPILTRTEFDRHSRASSSVIARRFGGWAHALELARLADRFSGTSEAKRTLTHGARTFSDEELLTELRAVAEKLGSDTVTIEQFNHHGAMNAETIRRRFGSWWRAVESAGLRISNLGKRYSETDYFENLLEVWTHHGRQPTYGEMDRAPSWIRAGAYEAKWGTWRGALKSFLDRVNSDVTESAETPEPNAPNIASTPRRSSTAAAIRQPVGNSRRRDIALGVRYDVLRRDRFRCVICGSSPAFRVGCELHVDHIMPVAHGGNTVLKNLRTLCSNCNIGKGAKVEST